MAVDIYVSDRLVATVGTDVMDWFERARASLSGTSPFSGLDPHGEVTFDAPKGEVAAFASRLSRALADVERAPEGLPALPVLADERDPDGVEFDAAGLVGFVRRLRDAMEAADASGDAVLAVGE